MRLAALLLAGVALSAPAAAEVRLPQATGVGGDVAVRVTTWRDIPFKTVVRQQYDYSCGSAALATLLKHHYGVEIGEADVFTAMYAAGDQAKIRKVGFSLLDMKRFLEARGWKADGFRLPLDKLAETGRPAIALIDLGSYRHFVVVKGMSGDRVLVGDPALGLKIYRRAEFEKMWNGVLFVPRPADGTEGAFNRTAEWRFRASPGQSALPEQALASFTTDIAPPIYQVLPIVEVSLPPGTGL